MVSVFNQADLEPEGHVFSHVESYFKFFGRVSSGQMLSWFTSSCVSPSHQATTHHHMAMISI